MGFRLSGIIYAKKNQVPSKALYVPKGYFAVCVGGCQKKRLLIISWAPIPNRLRAHDQNGQPSGLNFNDTKPRMSYEVERYQECFDTINMNHDQRKRMPLLPIPKSNT
ncbi:hypothetical protein DVH24_002517 [Malus domestica]|uniref:Uncharacterized protein n=1 Tax=Malus domestica TaxID=3750 RepID=A0A498IQF1_MALDO|nr:hypothetical protein DVH24_002517 [Malus domestica]